MNTNWEPIERAFRDLFEREWYTNHGPLGKAFELALQQLLGTQHAVCVVNPAIALTMALEALQLKTPIAVVGAFTSHTQSALHWSNTACTTSSPAAVLCNGAGSVELEKAQSLAKQKNVPLILDLTSLQAAELLPLCEAGVPGQCELLVLSFEHGQAIEAQGAACIATNNAALAETLRNIRSSYGTRATIPVTKTANGRMSEAQAAFGLISIQQLGKQENKQKEAL